MQRNVEKADPKVKALPIDNKRARRPLGNLLLLSGGTSLFASGIFLGPAASLAGAAAEPLERLTELGLEPNLLMLAGVMLLGLWLVSKHIRLHVQSLMQRDGSERALTEMGADLAEFCNRLVEFQGDHLHFRTELEGMSRQITAHRQGDRSGEAADGLFRMAASFDQLGANMGGQLKESVSSMRHNVDELGGLVAASRDFLQESVEDNGEKIRALQGSLDSLAQEIRQIPAALQLAQAFVAGTGLPALGATGATGEEAPEPEDELDELDEKQEQEPELDPEDCFQNEIDDAIELDPSPASGLGLLDDIEAFDEEAEESIFDDGPLAFFDRIESANNPQPPEPAPEEASTGEASAKEASAEETPASAPSNAAPTTEPSAEEQSPTEQAPEPELAPDLASADAIAPSTVPLEAPLPALGLKPEEATSDEQTASAPDAPLPKPIVPPALTGDAFASMPAPDFGPKQIDLTKPPENDPPGGPGNFPSIGF
ncbi:MAG: hypothetical protein ACI8QC_002282 [Planctomycetota bacterium]|jgi:hypothetical protein